MRPALPVLLVLFFVACGNAPQHPPTVIPTATPNVIPAVTPSSTPPMPTVDIEYQLCVDSLLIQERWLQEFKDAYRDILQLTDILQIQNAYQDVWEIASYIDRTGGNFFERCVGYFKVQSLQILGDQQIAIEEWNKLVDICLNETDLVAAGFKCQGHLVMEATE